MSKETKMKYAITFWMLGCCALGHAEAVKMTGGWKFEGTGTSITTSKGGGETASKYSVTFTVKDVKLRPQDREAMLVTEKYVTDGIDPKTNKPYAPIEFANAFHLLKNGRLEVVRNDTNVGAGYCYDITNDDGSEGRWCNFHYQMQDGGTINASKYVDKTRGIASRIGDIASPTIGLMRWKEDLKAVK